MSINCIIILFKFSKITISLCFYCDTMPLTFVNVGTVIVKGLELYLAAVGNMHTVAIQVIKCYLEVPNGRYSNDIFHFVIVHVVTL